MQEVTFPEASPIDPDQETTELEIVPRRRSRWYRIAAWVTAGSVGVGTVLALQNRELLSAAYEHMTYDAPDPGDIIPERIGCDIQPVDRFLPDAQEGNAAKEHERYIPEADPVFQEVEDKQSASNSFGETSAGDYADRQRIFWPFDNYFDKRVDQYAASIGVEFSFFMREGNTPFRIDNEAIEQMTRDIFGLQGSADILAVYQNPEVAEIVSCKRRQIIDEMALNNTRADVNIVVGGDAGFEGNNIVRRTPERNYAHSSGLGISDIAVHAGPWQLTPDHIILIAGGNGSLEISERILNRRFLHELLHVLMFQDLSDTVAERDEQERFVSFMERKLLDHYGEHGALPMVISIAA